MMEFERLVRIAQATAECNWHTAEDIVQDVYCDLAKNTNTVRDEEAYLVAAVTKRSLMFVRSKANKPKTYNFTDSGISPHGEGLAI
ncbi:MAG: hypothetical protein GY841_04355 [FCB group bacterium]|nr:hypothetical protein [FCB group bacterium]